MSLFGENRYCPVTLNNNSSHQAFFLCYVFRLRSGDERLVIPDTDADGGRGGCLLVFCRANGTRREDFRRNARSHEAATEHVI